MLGLKLNHLVKGGPAADALAPCITRSSAAMVLHTQNRHFIVFHEEGFQVLKNGANMFLCFLKDIQVDNG